MIELYNDLYKKLLYVESKIPTDLGGGSPVSKCFLMAYLVRTMQLKKYVEIGVYRGKSLLQLAVAIKENHGVAYGIDPYLSEDAKENDLNEQLKQTVNAHIDSLDFDDLYHQVLTAIDDLDMKDSVKLIRSTSNEAIADFKKNKIVIDMLHIDGNHDTVFVNLDAENYIPLVRDGGIIVFDDIDWKSVRVVYEKVKADYTLIYEEETFGILYKEKNNYVNKLKSSLAELKTDFCNKEKGEVSTKSRGLVIVDDLFPSTKSGFRYEEFLHYLKNRNNINIICSGQSFQTIMDESVESGVTKFLTEYPEYSDKIHTLPYRININQCGLFYFMFLNNAYQYIGLVEQANVPFVFELYPGGGFYLFDDESDQKLYRLFNSRCFKKVVVTQKITMDYLLNKGFCKSSDISYIFGCVEPQSVLNSKSTDKPHYKLNKKNLDICFTAAKYTPTGIDKGYDVFIQVAKQLSKIHDNIFFHVVGGFDESVLDVSDIKGRISFHGYQSQAWFDEFYKDKDMILSPNIPGVLHSGTFDGFPLGCSVDAGLREVAVLCTDELNLNNNHFKDGEEIQIIRYDVDSIVSKIEYYYQNPEKLKLLAINGMNAMKHTFSAQNQLYPRQKLLSDLLD